MRGRQLKLSPRREVWARRLPFPTPAWHGNFGFCSCPSVNGSWALGPWGDYYSISTRVPLIVPLFWLSCVHWRPILVSSSTSGLFLGHNPTFFVHSPSLSASWALLPVHLAATLPQLRLPLLHSSPPRPRAAAAPNHLSVLSGMSSPIPFQIFSNPAHSVWKIIGSLATLETKRCGLAHPALRGLSGLGPADLTNGVRRQGRGGASAWVQGTGWEWRGMVTLPELCDVRRARNIPTGGGWGGEENIKRGGVRRSRKSEALARRGVGALGGHWPGTLGRAPGCVEKCVGLPDPVLATPEPEGATPRPRSSAASCRRRRRAVCPACRRRPFLPPPRLPLLRPAAGSVVEASP